MAIGDIERPPMWQTSTVTIEGNAADLADFYSSREVAALVDRLDKRYKRDYFGSRKAPKPPPAPPNELVAGAPAISKAAIHATLCVLSMLLWWGLWAGFCKVLESMGR